MQYKISKNGNGKFLAYYVDLDGRWQTLHINTVYDIFFLSMTAAQDALRDKAEELDRERRSNIWEEVDSGEF